MAYGPGETKASSLISSFQATPDKLEEQEAGLEALDAALSSPSGQAVAVHEDGSVAGILRGDEIMRAIEEQRNERSDRREQP